MYSYVILGFHVHFQQLSVVNSMYPGFINLHFNVKSALYLLLLLYSFCVNI